MAARVEKLARRKQSVDSVDSLFSAFFISACLHIAGIFAIFLFQQFYSSFVPPKNIEKKPYAVHLIDPGPASRASEPLSKMKTERKTKDFEAPTKTVTPVKETSSVKKEMVSKPVKKEEPKQKQVEKVKAETKQPAKVEKAVTSAPEKAAEKEVVVEKQQGGQVYIQAFPYEWYIRLLENKIFANWDIIGVNFMAERASSVAVFFVIGRDGSLQGAKIEKSSGEGEVDSSAIKAVTDSAPFSPLPDGYKENTLEVHFAFKVTPER